MAPVSIAVGFIPGTTLVLPSFRVAVSCERVGVSRGGSHSWVVRGALGSLLNILIAVRQQ